MSRRRQLQVRARRAEKERQLGMINAFYDGMLRHVYLTFFHDQLVRLRDTRTKL